MIRSTFRALFAAGALTALALGSGCVADRPSRNGVFNENQYIQKSFLTTDGTHPDPGWFLQSTVTQVSTPNPLGGLGVFPAATTGFGSGLGYVQFAISSDKLQMVNMRQISSVSSPDNTPEVVNAWPITNVDLKYRVNLDGEKTNFYEENQELDWQVRQWVKVNFDKNDMSDTAPLGFFVTEALEKCTDTVNASATLVPNSFLTYEGPTWQQDYMQWTVQVSLPLNFDDTSCAEAFEEAAGSELSFGRQNVTFNLMYSMMRAKAADNPAADPNAYVPMVLDEKDPIRHKYGLFEIIPVDRDPSSELLAAEELVNRWNPNKPTTYYFTPNVPATIKDTFIGHRVYDSTDSENADSTGQCLDASHCTRTPDGIMQETNQVIQAAGNAKFTVSFLNANDATTFGDAAGPAREYGDVRYSFVHWVSDIDANTGWLGYSPNSSDPRTGEILNANVNLSDASNKAMAYQIDFYLQGLGASQGLGYSSPGGTPQDWPTTPAGLSGACTVGASVPLVNSVIEADHDGNSTLFTKMQQYLGKPAGTYGNLGPDDFIVNQDQDFLTAYYTLIPYAIFADPDTNAFVIREGGQGIFGPANFWDLMANEVQFHQIAATIDQGRQPFPGDITGTDGLANTTSFVNNWRQLTQNHSDLVYAQKFITSQQVYDAVDPTALVQVGEHAARHCIATTGGGTHWESKDEWVSDMITSFYDMISIHEFGHTLGLSHNFMGSVDQPNYPVKKDANGKPLKDANGNPEYAFYTNSVMEYSASMAWVFDQKQWGPYDMGALGWAYTNNAAKPLAAGQTSSSITGQLDATTPYNDKLGFQSDGKTEIQFMSCHDEHQKYTPLCRTWDLGSTPSAIIANQIDTYDWNWNFTNFRVYRKFWDNAHYADIPANLMMDLRRFLMLWIYDWNSGEITDTLRRIGFTPPSGIPALEYYTQLENKFNNELSIANQLVASFHKAVIQQSDGERPVATIYDQFYGDVTQQGIILDKLDAMQFWVGLWPGTNYDPNQAGAYFASYSDTPDGSYQTVAQDAVSSMIGGQYDAFPYFAPSAVALFAQDTHNPAFTGSLQIRNWIGGKVFQGANPIVDFLDYFRDLASQNKYVAPDGAIDCSQGFDACNYDPRTLSTVDGGVDPSHNEFIGPDQTYWIWAYVPDRNEYVAVQKYVNTASYLIVRAYNDDLVLNLDDGNTPGAAYGDELQMKYYLDSFEYYN
jgi:hypothetical protein